MLWDPFLIKKLLKSVICGTVNSTHMHCLQLTKSTIVGWKKKKEKENVKKKCRRGFHCKPNGHIDIWVSMKSRHAWLNIHFYYFFEESCNL